MGKELVPANEPISGYIEGRVTTVGKYAGRTLNARLNTETGVIQYQFYPGASWADIPKGTPFEKTFVERSLDPNGRRTGRYSTH